MINNIDNNPRSDVICNIALTGDLVLDAPDPDHWLGGIAGLLNSMDVAIGHLEVPHTNRGTELEGDVPAPGADPDALAALRRNGFTAVTMAGNHVSDQGAEGINDTLTGLESVGLQACGAGANIATARMPALIETACGRIALLSYNCVGPESAWANDDRAGCAYLLIETEDDSPVTPLAPLCRVSDDAKNVLEADISGVRRRADLVIVAMHKGIVHTPVVLAAYERPLAQFAIDRGADVVVGHHAHIVKGIEIYCGKPIFHGLGNGCVVTRALSPDQDHEARADWARRRKRIFGFEPDPAYELAPFHPEAVNGMVARLAWHADGRLAAGLVPVYVEPPGRPVRAGGERSAEVAKYIARISREAELPPFQLHDGDDMWVIG
jgi:poly-gamma-glutamate capsule biosynthesis protein CapA/YwtB (metallophosphatase superfamily)